MITPMVIKLVTSHAYIFSPKKDEIKTPGILPNVEYTMKSLKEIFDTPHIIKHEHNNSFAPCFQYFSKEFYFLI
jgi:hypothetical protein